MRLWRLLNFVFFIFCLCFLSVSITHAETRERADFDADDLQDMQGAALPRGTPEYRIVLGPEYEMEELPTDYGDSTTWTECFIWCQDMSLAGDVYYPEDFASTTNARPTHDDYSTVASADRTCSDGYALWKLDVQTTVWRPGSLNPTMGISWILPRCAFYKPDGTLDITRTETLGAIGYKLLSTDAAYSTTVETRTIDCDVGDMDRRVRPIAGIILNGLNLGVVCQENWLDGDKVETGFYATDDSIYGTAGHGDLIEGREDSYVYHLRTDLSALTGTISTPDVEGNDAAVCLQGLENEYRYPEALPITFNHVGVMRGLKYERYDTDEGDCLSCGNNSLITIIRPLCQKSVSEVEDPECGNGRDQAGEDCDDGNQNNYDVCTNECEDNECGDGFRNPAEEQCDDGNDVDTDACVNCVHAVCGDGSIKTGVEECDDGNLSDGDGCSAGCSIEECGNGILESRYTTPDGVEHVEECDGQAGISIVGAVCDAGCRQVCPEGTSLVPGEGGLFGTCVTPPEPVCGDGAINQPNEECDDGKDNGKRTSSCDQNCQIKCGNGVVDQAYRLPTGRIVQEECDPEDPVTREKCSETCQLPDPFCGDGEINQGEICDDGDANGTSTSRCTKICTDKCGDGVLQPEGYGSGDDIFKEECDPEAASRVGIRCDDKCTIIPATCGDKLVEGTEQCDDGNRNDHDGCTRSCKLNVCGDAIVFVGKEACDDGNKNPKDDCNACQFNVCGDGVLNPDEEFCDDGNKNSGDGCDDKCRHEFCGDGTVQPDEVCDDGNKSNNDGCLTTCRFAQCGDGFLLEAQKEGASSTQRFLVGGGSRAPRSEACDDGNRNDSDGCSSNCLIESCGDGLVQLSESCDDGNTVDGDGCNAACVLESCGDSVVQPGEDCDDGNDSAADACLPTCVSAFCGDGIKQDSESCDDGNSNAGDGCTPNCAIESCGNGVHDMGEQCDDGDRLDSDGCSSTCRIEIPPTPSQPVIPEQPPFSGGYQLIGGSCQLVPAAEFSEASSWVLLLMAPLGIVVRRIFSRL